MKVSAGKEPYRSDPKSHVVKLSGSWWSELSLGIAKETTEIEGESIWAKVRGSLLSLLDWLPLLGLLSVPHYYLVRKDPQSYFGDRDQWGFYNAIADQGAADEIFKVPCSPAADSVKHVQKKTLTAGKVVHLSIPSSFEPVNPDFTDRYWKHHAHRHIKSELWVHEGEPRPTFIVVHGYDTEIYGINRGLFSTRELYDMGCNICLIKLPFHRSKMKSFAETTHFFRHGPAYTNEVMAHAVHDCRTMISYMMDQQIASKVAIGGISLGSFVASLVVSAEKRLHAAVIIDPVYNLSDSLIEWPPVNKLIVKLLAQQGISFQQFRHAYACCNALTFEPVLASDRIMIIGSLYDRIAIPRYVKLLGEHWNQCLLVWKGYSHVGVPVSQPFWTEIKAHLTDTGFIEP
ncbi:MAG: hypothetical protein COB04_01005 [Gammaproteobacteria bacterium]|nr:MAG: hypothetical protein COB04_01005 [Gammaproteobacteria bacterium]